MLEINKVYQGDCLEVMKDIDDNSIDLIVTDPPYLINYKTNHRKNKEHEFCSVIQNDNNPLLISEYIKQCNRIMKDNSAMYMFCSCDKVDFFKQELEKYFKIKNIIIWVKNNWTAGDLKGQFGKQYEMILLVNKGRKEINGKRYSDVWNFKRVAGNKQTHQNEKPVNLIEQCISSHSTKNDLVFDGFAGSGTTGVACKNLNRNYILIEKEPKYIDIINKRLSEQVQITI